MVNVDFSPALVLGLGMVGGGLLLYNVRLSRPWISRDYDVVISSVSILTGGILVFQVLQACNLCQLWLDMHGASNDAAQHLASQERILVTGLSLPWPESAIVCAAAGLFSAGSQTCHGCL